MSPLDMFDEGTIAQRLSETKQAFDARVQNPLTAIRNRAPTRADPLMLGRTLRPEYTVFIDCDELGIHIAAPLPPSFDWSVESRYSTPIRDTVDGFISGLGTIGSAVKAGMQGSGISLVTQALTAKFWDGSATGAIALPLILQAEKDALNDVTKPYLQLMALSMPRFANGKRGGLLEAPGPHFDLVKAANAAQSMVSKETKSVAGQQSLLGSAITNAFGDIKGRLAPVPGLVANGDYSGVLGVANKALNDGANALDSFAQNSIRNKIRLQIGRYIVLDSVVITAVSQTHLMQPIGGEGYGEGTESIQRVEMNVTFEPFMDLTLNDLPNIFLDLAAKALAEEIISGTGTPSVKSTIHSGGY